MRSLKGEDPHVLLAHTQACLRKVSCVLIDHTSAACYVSHLDDSMSLVVLLQAVRLVTSLQ